jgi:hypothetical protein
MLLSPLNAVASSGHLPYIFLQMIAQRNSAKLLANAAKYRRLLCLFVCWVHRYNFVHVSCLQVTRKICIMTFVLTQTATWMMLFQYIGSISTVYCGLVTAVCMPLTWCPCTTFNVNTRQCCFVPLNHHLLWTLKMLQSSRKFRWRDSFYILQAFLRPYLGRRLWRFTSSTTAPQRTYLHIHLLPRRRQSFIWKL